MRAPALHPRPSTPPRSYADYLLDTLAKRELFQWLSLTPARFWHTLLFADRCARNGPGLGGAGVAWAGSAGGGAQGAGWLAAASPLPVTHCHPPHPPAADRCQG